MHGPGIPLQPDSSRRVVVRPSPLSGSPYRNGETKLVYVVDDMLDITELYHALLNPLGCFVKSFNDRVEALVALQAEHRIPDLLITDYISRTMSADEFMIRCRGAHPDLRILMISGFDQTELQLSNIHADGFLHKPFAAEEFEAAVNGMLIRV